MRHVIFGLAHTESKALISSSSSVCVCVCVGYISRPPRPQWLGPPFMGAEQRERERSARASITRRNGPSIVPPPSPLSLTCRKNPSSRQSDHHDLFHKRLGMICNIYIPSLSLCVLTAFPHIIEKNQTFRSILLSS